jgi:pyrroline-5-carboxylate reductase
MAGEIVFIGGGNMGRALLGGLIADGVPTGQLAAAEPDAGRRAALTDELGMRTAAQGRELVADASVVVLAVKPQVLRDVVQGLAGHFGGHWSCRSSPA